MLLTIFLKRLKSLKNTLNIRVRNPLTEGELALKNIEKATANKFLLIYDFIAYALAYVVTKIFLNADIHAFLDIFTEKTIFSRNDVAYFACMVLIYYGVLFLTKNSYVMWMYAGTKNYLNFTIALLAVAVINILISVLVFTGWRLAILYSILTFIWSLLSRMAVRAIYKIHKFYSHKSKSYKIVNALIVGAGSGGSLLLKELQTNDLSQINYNIVGFVDDNEEKIGKYVEKIKVLGSTNDIPKICSDYSVQEIYLAIPSIKSSKRSKILELCSETGCRLKIMVSFEHTLTDGGSMQEYTVRNVEIEDLLERETVSLDNSAIRSDIENQTVMVTGGGGSIGSELARQIAKFNPEKLIILDVYENNAYDLQMELSETYPDLKLEVVIASVRDMTKMDQIFSKTRPHIVFHAAAHKHVPLMEDAPGEAIKNNVFGTYNVAICADKYKASKFVMISTDKAVNPTNVMGATKRMCEMIVQAMDKISETKFVAVRFGNVLGSNGSVIPIFKRQIAHGGPVKVTHKDITRFFMTIPEATQLVIQAATSADGGEIFILDMGSPVRIYDLAENLIRLSGYRPNVDIPIEITGLRPGEKLYEELLMDEEGLENAGHEKIYVGKPSEITIEEVMEKLNILKESLKNDDPDVIKAAISKVVPTYKRTDN